MRHLMAGLSLLALLALAGGQHRLGAQTASAAATAMADLPSYASSSALRAGVAPAGWRAERVSSVDTSATGGRSRSHRGAHAAIGGGIGLVAGAAMGAAIAGHSDRADEAIGVPAAAYGAVVGGVIGLAVGAVAGAFIR